MRKKFIMYIMMTTLFIVPLYASATEISELSDQQAKLQAKISKSTDKISEYQNQLNTTNMELESNEREISELNADIDEIKRTLSNEKSSVAKILTIMQKMNNQNTIVKYMMNDNGESFLLKYSNIVKVNDLLGTNISEVEAELKALSSKVETINQVKSETLEKQDQINQLLDEQKETETELKTDLAGVDSDLLDAKQQISIENAKKMQAEAEAAKAEQEAKAKAEQEAKEKAEKEAEAKLEEEEETVVENEQETTPEVETPDSIYPSNGDVSSMKNELMANNGISSSDYKYVDYIITHESGWNYLISNSVSGAYGLCQALPGNKMSSSGSDWATNPNTQISWCNSYALSSYGSWSNAYNFWIENNWW